MSFNLTITENKTYLHIIVTGENKKENVMQYMEQIISECFTRNCFRVLIEERLVGPRLGTFDVYSIASQGAMNAFGKMKAIAYVDINSVGDLMNFAETVAVNRSLPVKIFSKVAEAEKWLLSNDNQN